MEALRGAAVPGRWAQWRSKYLLKLTVNSDLYTNVRMTHFFRHLPRGVWLWDWREGCVSIMYMCQVWWSVWRHIITCMLIFQPLCQQCFIEENTFSEEKKKTSHPSPAGVSQSTVRRASFRHPLVCRQGGSYCIEKSSRWRHPSCLINTECRNEGLVACDPNLWQGYGQSDNFVPYGVADEAYW